LAAALGFKLNVFHKVFLHSWTWVIVEVFIVIDYSNQWSTK
jgi:hypothetical protein